MQERHRLPLELLHERSIKVPAVPLPRLRSGMLQQRCRLPGSNRQSLPRAGGAAGAVHVHRCSCRPSRVRPVLRAHGLLRTVHPEVRQRVWGCVRYVQCVRVRVCVCVCVCVCLQVRVRAYLVTVYGNSVCGSGYFFCVLLTHHASPPLHPQDPGGTATMGSTSRRHVLHLPTGATLV